MTYSKEIFKKYLNHFFIETGSYFGEGIQQAIDVGFQKILSVELGKNFFDYCSQRFANNKKVQLFKGESHLILPQMLAQVNCNATFWLDGHYSYQDTALGSFMYPIMQELAVIKEHHIKSHTIMIDDIRCWKDSHIPINDVINFLSSINNDYEFVMEDGHQANDILVAKLKEELSK